MKKVQLIPLQTTISILYVTVHLIIGIYVAKLKKKSDQDSDVIQW